MRLTIAVKRAQLIREWLYAMHGNNERYYYSTLALGIPDGDDYETVLSDLQDGFYDDDIDDILHMYRNRREVYGKDGYYYNGNVYHNPDDCIDAAGFIIPDRVYIKR